MNTNQQNGRFVVLKVAVLLHAVAFVVLWTSVSASACPADNKQQSDKDQASAEGCITQVFRHTYDDVFQAAKEALERKGKILETVTKEKGIATYKDTDVRLAGLLGHRVAYCKVTIQLQIEPLTSTAEPQSRVTVNVNNDLTSREKACHKAYQGCFESLFSDVQKVLATYN